MNEKYNKTEWINGQTRVTADHMNNIENGISKLFELALSGKELESGPGIYVRKNIETGKYKIGLNYTIITIKNYEKLKNDESIDPLKIYLVVPGEDETLLKLIVIGGVELNIK